MGERIKDRIFFCSPVIHTSQNWFFGIIKEREGESARRHLAAGETRFTLDATLAAIFIMVNAKLARETEMTNLLTGYRFK